MTTTTGFREATATVSADGRFRYRLGRRWAENGGTVLFAMLNPSTADALVDDPTIRRCIGFAQSWGYAALDVVNLFAYRATDPRKLFGHDPAAVVGPENDEHIRALASRADLIVAAWGASLPKGGEARSRHVLELLRQCGDVHHLGLTAKGQPRHPLYLRGDVTPSIWRHGRFAT